MDKSAAYAVEPCNAAIGIADAEYVLAWLRQSDAPENIVGLQERTVRIFRATEATLSQLGLREALSGRATDEEAPCISVAPTIEARGSEDTRSTSGAARAGGKSPGTEDDGTSSLKGTSGSLGSDGSSSSASQTRSAASRSGVRREKVDRDELGSLVSWLRGSSTDTIPEGCREPWLASLERILAQIDREGMRYAADETLAALVPAATVRPGPKSCDRECNENGRCSGACDAD